MKKLFLIGFIFFLAFDANSQGEPARVSFVIGPSFPFGNFASTSRYSRDAGMAKIGWSLGTDVEYRLSKLFGILAAYRFQENGKKELQYRPHTGPTDRVWYDVEFNEDPWSMHSVLLGGYYSPKISKTFYFDVGLKAGGLRLTNPEMNRTMIEYYLIPGVPQGSGYDTVYSYSTTSKTTCDWSLEVSGFARFRYPLQKKLSLIAVAEYFYSKPTVKEGDYTFLSYHSSPSRRSPDYTAETPGTYSYQQEISVLNISVGVQFLF